MRDDYDTNTAGTAPTNREFSNFSYFHDRLGNITHRRNDQQGAGFAVGTPAIDRWPDRDWKYQYDGLNRLVTAVRGVIGQDDASSATSPSFTSATPPVLTRSIGSQNWKLDALGNWSEFGVDFDNSATPATADPTFSSGEVSARDDASPGGSAVRHNQANEVPRLPKINDAAASGFVNTWHGAPYAAERSGIGGFVYDDNGNRIGGRGDRSILRSSEGVARGRRTGSKSRGPGRARSHDGQRGA